MYIDRIDLTLPEGDITALLASFTSARTQLEFLPSVSPSDRKHYAKLGLKNEALARQIIEVGRQNPDLIPRGIDFEKIDRDLVAREQLQALKLVLEALLGRISDSLLLTGVDIYAAALSMYHCLRRNADTTSLKETVDELKKGFARPSRKKKQVETAPVSVPAPAPETSAKPPVDSAAHGGSVSSGSTSPATEPVVQVPSPNQTLAATIVPLTCSPHLRSAEALTPDLPVRVIRKFAGGTLAPGCSAVGETLGTLLLV